MDHTDSISDDEPFDKVVAWFIGPIRALRDLRDENADGAFLALSASLAMYERFLIKKGQEINSNTEDDRAKIGGQDLGIGTENFRLFWSCFRDGLQHQFQPTKKRNGRTYYWNTSKDHQDVPEVTDHGDKTVTIKINPWGFAELVYSRYEKNMGLFEKAKSHSPGEIQSVGTSFPQLSPVVDATPGEIQSPMNMYQTLPLETGVFRPFKNE